MCSHRSTLVHKASGFVSSEFGLPVWSLLLENQGRVKRHERLFDGTTQ